MSMTTNIRFLDPVDPRQVWMAGSTLIHAPDDYRVDRIAADRSDRWQKNAEWRAEPDQGADALMWMLYGHEGALLIDVDGYYGDEPIPPAYVHLSIDTPYGCNPEIEHDKVFAILSKLFAPVTVVWQRGEVGPEWYFYPRNDVGVSA